MTHAALDYRFAWRCLLPAAAVANAGLRLFGFTDDEAQFWRHWCAHQTGPVLGTVGALAPEQAQAASLLLVDAERCPASAWPTAAELAQAAVVAVVADRAQGRLWRRALGAAFPAVSEFALLPAAQPRVVVPLSAPGHALAGLGLHRPGRWVARAGVSLARALAAMGQFSLLRGRVLLIAQRARVALPVGAWQAGLPAAPDGQPWQAFAAYLGTPDDRRKTVMLPLGQHAPTVILKAGSSPRARAALGNEAAALVALAGSPLATQVPRLLGQRSHADTLTLQQEYRPRRRVAPARLTAAVVAFLGQLAGLSAQAVALAPLLVTLAAAPAQPAAPRPRAAATAAAQALRARLDALCAQGQRAWLQRTHGDFAPWNCGWSDHGLFVYDWEDSHAQGLALGDAFYYAIAPALLLQRKPRAAATLAATLALAERVAAASHTPPNVRLQLALWLLGRAGTAPLYDELLIALERSWT